MSRSDESLRRAVLLLAAAALPLLPTTARAGVRDTKLELLADGRAAVTSGETGWLDEGLGKTRYGGRPADTGNRANFAVADLSLLARTDWSWTLASYIHLQHAPEQEHPLDVVEAWLGYRPTPRGRLRFQARGGLYFPHISREHAGKAWTSPYSITPSAANSWVGEEIRAVGGEMQLSSRGEQSQVSLTVGLFGFNDPAGTLLAFRGWAMGDVKATAFGRLPLAPLPSIGVPDAFLKRQVRWVQPVCEVDGRVGHHLALDAAWGRRLQVGGFYYDNNGDPRVLEHQQYAWDTRFANFYVQSESESGLTVIAQYMTGVTAMGWRQSNGQIPVDVDYYAGFLLVSQRAGELWLTVRHDRFATEDNSFVAEDDNTEDGSAWTLALGRDLGRRGRVICEYLRVDSTRPARQTVGIAASQVQTQVQLSYRVVF